MNRDRDFHKKSEGILINKNTKDYRRAKNRNKVMKTAVAALGKDGELTKVSKKVKDMSEAPSRAEERVAVLEKELIETNAINKEIKIKMAGVFAESKIIKDQLRESNSLNQEISEKLDVAFALRDDFDELKQLIKSLENK